VDAAEGEAGANQAGRPVSRGETLTWKLLGALRRTGLLERVNVVVPVTHRGRRIRVPVRAGVGLGHRALTEPHLWPALRASLALRPGAFVDVGAHLGETLIKLLALGDGRRYVGFEPQVAAADYVRRLLALNRPAGDVVVAAALGDRGGTAELLLAGELEGSASIVPGFRTEDFYVRTTVVPLLRGDDVLGELGAGPVGVVKIDAEGAELDVLRGLERTIETDRPLILCEILPVYDERGAQGKLRREREQALIDLLTGCAYRLLRIEPTGAVEPLDRIETHADLRRCDYAFVPETDVNRFLALAGS
jgi:FkbM family methyltransferase